MLLEDCKVLENKRVNGNYFLMKLSSQNLAEKCKAGQFFMLKMKNEITILRRPISIHNVDKKNGVIEFYYEVKGRGTIEMADKQEGDLINLQGPLGNGFKTDYEGKTLLIVGGGMGLAPLKYLVEELKSPEKNNKIIFIAGGRNKGALEILKNFNFGGIEFHIVTDDGSLGNKGNVIEMMKEIVQEKHIDAVMSCGPHRVLELVGGVAGKKEIYAEISLEERMACGVKACVGCSIKTLQGMKKVCHDGPVFDSKIIVEVNPKDNEPCSCS